MAKTEIEATIGNLARINVLQDRAKALNAAGVGPVRHVRNDFAGSTSLQALMVHRERATGKHTGWGYKLTKHTAVTGLVAEALLDLPDILRLN